MVFIQYRLLRLNFFPIRRSTLRSTREAQASRKPSENINRQLQVEFESLQGYGGQMTADLKLWMLVDTGTLMSLDPRDQWVKTGLMLMLAGMEWD
jgi:hypothetical protein